MQENKINKELYYKPEIEEFHYGFEYEQWREGKYSFYIIDTTDATKNFQLQDSDGTHKEYAEWWKTKITGENDFYPLELKLKNNQIRVKFLDKSDIEELGWKDISLPQSISVHFEKQNCRLYYQDTTLVISKGIGIYYRGECKNKNELRYLMKKLKIDNTHKISGNE